MGPPHRDVRAAAAALVMAVACSGPGGPPAAPEGRRLPVSYPMAAFGSEHPDRMRIWGKPLSRWVGSGPTRGVAVVAYGSSGVWVKPGFPVERLAGKVGISGTCAGEGARARFRVLVAQDPAAGSRRTVWQSEEMGTGDAWLPVGIPLDAAPGAWVGIESEVEPAEGCEELMTVWLDPVLLGSQPAPEPKERRPNVLLVTADTTRYDALLDASGKATLPGIAALAADGVVLRRAWSVAYGTTPSHASLLSSTYASRHGVFDNRTVLRAEETTLAEVLAGEGYRTAAFVGAVPVSRALGFTQGFQHYDDVFAFDPRSGLEEFSNHERRAETTVTLFSRWLAANGGRPFFAWLHFFDPHQPYAPRETAAVMPGGAGRPSILRTADGAPRLVLLEEGAQDAETERRIEAEVRVAYGKEVAAMDAQLARVLRGLRGAGIYDDTMIVFVADHGETFLEHGPAVAFRHAGLHAEVARLPAVVKLPGGRSAGTVRDALVGNVDLAPTILDVLGIPAPQGWQGRSLARVLAGGGQAPRTHMLLEGAHRGEVSVRTAERMYRRVTLPGASPELLRALGYRGDREELFDLASDPAERRNIAASDPACTAELRALADALRAEVSTPGGAGNASIDTEEHRKALEALGYLQ